MRRTLQIALLLLFTGVAAGSARAQVTLNQDNADCTGAVFITDSVHVCEQPLRGVGNILEIKENPQVDKAWFEREHNTTWYMFRSPANTTITMDIIPKNLDDDIDFLIFEGAVPGICDKIQSKQVVPVRTNISRNDKSIDSKCGLSKEATEDYVRSGVGSSYSKALPVEEGELFYLVVDYQEWPKDGYTIRFHYDPPYKPAVPEPVDRRQALHVKITDAKSGKPIDAAVSIAGMEFDSIVKASGKSEYDFKMEPYRNLKYSCLRKGYLFCNGRVKGTMDPSVDVEVKLTPIAPGEHVTLDDIRFVGNDTKVMRTSETALLLLVTFMQENPNVKVEIQGHVNGPTYKNTKEFIQLSTGRARTVYDFLLVNDVDPARVSYVGMGNSKMLYPDPNNKEESEANRRVEVKVLSN